MTMIPQFNAGTGVPAWTLALGCVVLLCAAASPALGQGSIFGAVTNSDASTPSNGELSFLGYIDDTDEEIRIETCVGAGYDVGNWFDDFQNYLTEAPGNPYDYHFYNIVNGEGFILSKSIPNNSFQQEDITLASVTWPAAPTGLTGQAVSSSSIVVSWPMDLTLTYHVYRRSASSNGSLFRIDDPGGSLSNPGVSDSFFVDNSVDGFSSYHYLIVAEDASGNLSPHSSIIEVNSATVVKPTVTGISPNSGVALGGTPVTVFGTGFDMAGASVTIDGNPLASVAVVSPFEITGLTPAGAIGPADIVVTNTSSGLASDPLVGGFTYSGNQAPTVAGIPDQTIPEGGSFVNIDLDAYVSDPDHDPSDISWNHSGDVELSVVIDGNRIATVSPPNGDWFGAESIVFRGTDPGGLFDEDTALFTVTPINDPPVVAGIPNQSIIGAGPGVPIDLDNYVADVDNSPAEMTWSSSGGSNLGIDITGRVATITLPDPAWVGTDTIIFRATDPGLDFDEDTIIFVHAAVNQPEPDFKSVLVGHPDTLFFSIQTPDGFTLVSPIFNVSNPDVVVGRTDGSDIGTDIPPGADIQFRAIWTPSDTLTDPGTIDISSVSVDNTGLLVFDGRPVIIVLAAPFASHDFGDVNAVDIRAADTLTVDADISGNTQARVIGTSLSGDVEDFSILTPVAGDTLIPGAAVSCIALAHPTVIGIRTAEFWIRYQAELTGGTFIDSVKILDLTANGAQPGCLIVESVVDFGERKIGETHSKAVTLENSSTVVEIIDSLYFSNLQNIFGVDPGVTWPLALPPGDTTIDVLFSPPANQFYSATLRVADSAAGDCGPPQVRGIGVNDYVHLESDPSTYLGLVKLCDTLSVTDYRIANRSTEFSLVLDGFTIDSAGWFTIEPDPATLVGTVLAPSDSIILNRIRYHPRGLLPAISYSMTVAYHIDTVGAVSENYVTIPVSAAGGCAGQSQVTPGLTFGSVDIGAVSRDTAILTNTGNCTLVIDSVAATTSEFTLPGFSTPATINPGQSVNLIVRFTPTDIGTRQGSIVLYHDGYNAGFNPDTDCPLQNQDEILCTGLGIDTSPPTISSITAGNCGQIVAMQISDIGSGIDTVYALWREGNSVSDFRTATNEPQYIVGDQWQWLLSTADMDYDSVNVYGYEIRIMANDREGNADTMTSSISGCLPELDGGAFISGSRWLGNDGQDTLWHLVSFPGDLPSYRVDSIFIELSGMVPSNDYQGDFWRLYEYRGGTFRALPTGNSQNRVAAGRGYWFRHIQALDTLRIAGINRAFTWPTLTAFDLSLEFGWNLLGSPYLFQVFLDDTNLDTLAVSSFVRQTQPAISGGRNWWELIDVGGSLPPLEPWQGYAIYCEQPGGCTITLDPHYVPAPDSVAARRFWTTSIFLHDAGGLAGRVDIGAGDFARYGPDISDVRPIEAFVEKPRMLLNHPEYGSFIRDIRAEGSLLTWNPEISIDDDTSGPLWLRWSIDGAPDVAKQMVLRDNITGVTVDMKTEREFLIKNPLQTARGRFVVYYGDREAVEAALQEITPSQPRTFRLYQNFPNPFNPRTTIAFDIPSPGFVGLNIYDITGRKVRELVAAYYQAGGYQVDWDGRDGRGDPVATGIYLYRLEANGFVETRKLLLLK